MDRLMRLDLKEIYSFEETIENIKIFKNTSKTNTLAIYYESHFKSVSTRFIASITTLKNIIEKEYPNVDPYKFMMFIFEYSLINKDQELDIHTAARATGMDNKRDKRRARRKDEEKETTKEEGTPTPF